MKIKTKIMIAVLLTVMLSVSFSSTINAEQIENRTQKKLTVEKTDIKEQQNLQSLNKGLLIPRFFVATLIEYEGFEIINAEADEIQNIENGTYYIGNVEIKAKLTGDSVGYLCSYLANKIGLMLLKMGRDPSILPGWYVFPQNQEFTIKARFLFLSDYVEPKDFHPFIAGFGFFVRITK